MSSTHTVTTLVADELDPDMRHYIHDDHKATLFLMPVGTDAVVNLYGTFDELDEAVIRISEAIVRARTAVADKLEVLAAQAESNAAAPAVDLMAALEESVNNAKSRRLSSVAAGVDCEATQ